MTMQKVAETPPMTPEREAVARDGEPNFIEGLQGFASMCDSGAVDKHDGPMLANKFRDAAVVISMLQKLRDERGAEVARLRSALATAERERDEARDLAQRSTRRLVELSQPGWTGAFAARDDAEARAASLEGLLTEARENQAASQRMTASVERSLNRSIALHEAAEAALDEAGKALKPFVKAANGCEAFTGSWPLSEIGGLGLTVQHLRDARDTLTRIEAREGGEEKGKCV